LGVGQGKVKIKLLFFTANGNGKDIAKPLSLTHAPISPLRPLKAKAGINLSKIAIFRQKRFSRICVYFRFIISHIWIVS
jgi:hypothetical protein